MLLETSNQTSQELMGIYHILTLEVEAIGKRIIATTRPQTLKALIAKHQEAVSKRIDIMEQLGLIG
jgi:hypothetical protein